MISKADGYLFMRRLKELTMETGIAIECIASCWLIHVDRKNGDYHFDYEPNNFERPFLRICWYEKDEDEKEDIQKA